MGIRYLLLGVVLWLLFSVIRRYLWQRRTRHKANQERDAMNMVACDYCGTHLPQSEAICQGSRYYCDKDHLRLSKKGK